MILNRRNSNINFKGKTLLKYIFISYSLFYLIITRNLLLAQATVEDKYEMLIQQPLCTSLFQNQPICGLKLLLNRGLSFNQN